ncbi:MAG: hypothetical protein KF791_12515 [Verrucomicrobiae bacterium]|nr:hypothetical protein [Verrucomicrobiae bacterium]
MTPESVLCSRACDLPEAWRPETLSLPLTEEQIRAVLAPLPPVWISRQEAEHDERYLQWIPYLLLRDARRRLAAYPRQGADTRLHGRWSLGVGGHINPVDAADAADAASDGGSAWTGLLQRGLRRELSEEFPGAVSGVTRFLGLIHERHSAVGRVHIGAVYLHELSGDPGEPGTELAGLRWVAPGELGGAEWPWNRLELWSQLALALMPRSA